MLSVQGHIRSDWLQSDSAGGLPTMNLPAVNTWPNGTRTSTINPIDDLSTSYNGTPYNRAPTIEEDMIESYETAFKKGYLPTLVALDNLVDVYNRQGRGLDAVRVWQKVLEVYLRYLGEGHPHTLTAMDNLAATYGILGWSSEQRRLRQNIVRIQAEWLGEDHQDTIATRKLLIQMEVKSADVRQVRMRWNVLVSDFGIKLAGQSRTPP